MSLSRRFRGGTRVLRRLCVLAPVLFLGSLPAERVAAQSTALGSPRPAGMTADVREIRYDVTGATAEEIRRSMLASGPRDEGRAWYGYTAWNVRWRYDFDPTEDGCRIDRATVRFRARMHLPRWEPGTEVETGLVSDWHAFVAALREHEEGHRDIGAEAAREILRRLRAFRWARCDGLSERANRAAREILDGHRQEERRYDRRTEHGSTQGAVWPPNGRESHD